MEWPTAHVSVAPRVENSGEDAAIHQPKGGCSLPANRMDRRLQPLLPWGRAPEGTVGSMRIGGGRDLHGAARVWSTLKGQRGENALGVANRIAPI